LKASFLPLSPSSPVCFPGENLDLGRTTTAPVASLEALLVVVVCSLRRMSTSAPTFAHLVYFSGLFRSSPGGCFAALLGQMLCRLVALVSSGCFAALLGWVDALPPCCVVDPCTLVL